MKDLNDRIWELLVDLGFPNEDEHVQEITEQMLIHKERLREMIRNPEKINRDYLKDLQNIYNSPERGYLSFLCPFATRTVREKHRRVYKKMCEAIQKYAPRLLHK